jgi:hypothetical protein
MFIIIGLTLALSVIPLVTKQGARSIVEAIAAFLLGCVVFFLFYELRSIISTVAVREPFRIGNVKRFKNIAVCIFILGALDTLINLNSEEGIRLIGTPYFNLHPQIFIYIVLGCLGLVLAEVFAVAAEIKKDNDLTI